MKKALSLLLVLLMILSAVPAFADDSNNMNEDGYSTSYTYIYDFWDDSQESPDAYRVKTVIDSMTIGLENLGGLRLNRPQVRPQAGDQGQDDDDDKDDGKLLFHGVSLLIPP